MKNVKIFVVIIVLNFSLHMNKTTILVCGCVMTTEIISSKGDTHLWLSRNQTNQIVLSRVTAIIILKSLSKADTKGNESNSAVVFVPLSRNVFNNIYHFEDSMKQTGRHHAGCKPHIRDPVLFCVSVPISRL